MTKLMTIICIIINVDKHPSMWSMCY